MASIMSVRFTEAILSFYGQKNARPHLGVPPKQTKVLPDEVMFAWGKPSWTRHKAVRKENGGL